MAVNFLFTAPDQLESTVIPNIRLPTPVLQHPGFTYQYSRTASAAAACAEIQMYLPPPISRWSFFPPTKNDNPIK